MLSGRQKLDPTHHRSSSVRLSSYIERPWDAVQKHINLGVFEVTMQDSRRETPDGDGMFVQSKPLSMIHDEFSPGIAEAFH